MNFFTRRLRNLFIILLFLLCLLPFRNSVRHMCGYGLELIGVRRSVADRIEQYGVTSRNRWKKRFSKKHIKYPSDRVVLVGIKTTKQLEVWCAPSNSVLFKHVHTFPILASSGKLGPKLQEGDCQVPEGVYNIESLNPNSMYHLSLRLNYPNIFDIKHAKIEGRKNIGKDIMIHGNICSLGCLAMGDEAAEDLFVLTADVGISKVKVILTPVDFRKQEMPELSYDLPSWTHGLYENIENALSLLSATPKRSQYQIDHCLISTNIPPMRRKRTQK